MYNFSVSKSIVGTTDVCVNPSDDTLQQIPAVSISTEDLCLRNGQQVWNAFSSLKRNLIDSFK